MKLISSIATIIAIISSIAFTSKTSSSFISNIEIETITKKDTIYYVFDPLYGWCYGFAPVISKFNEEHKKDYHIEIISGGMMTGNRIMPASNLREFITKAHKQVEKSTGIQFGEKFFQTLNEGTGIFTSVEPSIALEAFRNFQPENTIDFAHDIQKAI